jgi:hypothetical protein
MNQFLIFPALSLVLREDAFTYTVSDPTRFTD